MHWASGTCEETKVGFFDLGMPLVSSGTVTFKKSRANSRLLAQMVPFRRLLIETGLPVFIPPCTKRGEKNEMNLPCSVCRSSTPLHLKLFLWKRNDRNANYTQRSSLRLVWIF
jgi:Tat protein secretion system quality control protein TatD with DNase activity